MDLYAGLSMYYDDLFPVSAPEESFLTQLTSRIPNPKWLDLACGTGEHALLLARRGLQVTGLDLESEMIAIAQRKATQEGLTADFGVADMRDLTQLADATYEIITCLGNSLPHLPRPADITQSLQQMRLHLKKDGLLAIQIINFNRILQDGVTHLPEIVVPSKGLHFIRRYTALPNKHIAFHGELTTPSGEFTGTVELLPLTREELSAHLDAASLTPISWFGHFDLRPWQADSFHTICLAAPA